MKRNIIDIRSDECHFALTDGVPHFFCGEPVQPGSSYCSPHHRRCHAGFGRPWKSVEFMMLTMEGSVTYTRKGVRGDVVRDVYLAESPVTVPVDVHIRGDK